MTRTPVPRDETHIAAIPTWLYESGQLAELGGAGALIALALYSSIAPGRSKQIGQRLLARRTGLHHRSVARAIDQLVALGLITAERHGRGRTIFSRPARPARAETPTASAPKEHHEDRRPRTQRTNAQGVVCDLERAREHRRAAGLLD